MGIIYDTLTRGIASTIGIFFPDAALRYLHSQKNFERTYSAAKTSGHNQLWKPKQTSGYKEIKDFQRKVTDRARDLEQNNPYIRGLVKKFVVSVVGEGQWPKAKALLPGGKELDAELNSNIEWRWDQWQRTAGTAGQSFCELQQVVAWHLLVDGGCLVRKIAKPKQSLALEVLEYDQLDDSKDADLSNGGSIKSGNELDKYGAPVAYWIKPKHPAEKDAQSVRVTADQVLHIFARERASHVRGICHFASVINDIYDTAAFQDATLILARVATAYGVFVKSEHPEDFVPDAATSGTGEDGSTPLQYVNPGGIHYLRPGESIETTKAEQPGAVYDPFVRSRLRAASVGAGASYESFSNDYSQGSYSSARQAMLLERAMYRYASAKIDELLNVPVYRWFVEDQYRFAGLPLRGFEAEPWRFYAVKFSRPRQEWIDPLKEANAANMRLKMGMETLTELCEAEGRDIDEVMATRSAEIARMKELGIWQLDPTPEAIQTESAQKKPEEVNDDTQDAE